MVFGCIYDDIRELMKSCCWEAKKAGDSMVVFSNWGV